MNELNENKNSETKSGNPASPAKEPKSPKSPATPTALEKLEVPEQKTNQPESKDLQAGQPLQESLPDLQANKPIDNAVSPESQGIKADYLDLLKTPIEKPADDLEILDTKPGLVEEKISNGDIVDGPSENLESEEAPADELVFKKALDPNERKHYEIIVRSQKDNVSALRRQVQALVAHINTLPETEESKKLLESLSTL